MSRLQRFRLLLRQQSVLEEGLSWIKEAQETSSALGLEGCQRPDVDVLVSDLERRLTITRTEKEALDRDLDQRPFLIYGW
jgi:hypothetical protein